MLGKYLPEGFWALQQVPQSSSHGGNRMELKKWKVFEARLDGALGSLVWWKLSLTLWQGLELDDLWDLWDPFNPKPFCWLELDLPAPSKEHC